MDGVVILDKPAGVSSHDAVQRVRRIVGTKRVGHLGTLDPIGTGVLPMVVGKATRLAQFFLNHDRCYEATIRCGFATTTYDREGELVGEPVEVRLDEDEVRAALEGFTGRFLQTPPPISAKKIGGVPAYKLARMNEPVELKPVAVEIYELELLGVEEESFRLRVRCSAGTYLRSLAHESGHKLGVGAHVAELRRIAMGEFDISMARTLEDLERLKEEERLDEAYVSPDRVLPEIPAHRVDAEQATRIAHGRDFRVTAFSAQPPAKRVKAIGPDGRLLAIGEIRLPTIYHPIVVF